MAKEYSVLVIEDESDGAAVVTWMLKAQKIKSTVVENGEDAIQQMQSSGSNFNAMLVDLALPGMDGFQLLKYFKEQAAPSIPMIAMTAFHTPELREKALNAGFDAYIPKPIEQAALAKALASVLG